MPSFWADSNPWLKRVCTVHPAYSAFLFAPMHGGGLGLILSGMSSSLRKLVLPREHGAWGMLLEPMLVGCLVLPTWVGGGACLAIFLTFLARRPVVVGWFLASSVNDPQQRRKARWIGIVLLSFATAGLAVVLWKSAGGMEVVVVLAAAVILGATNFMLDRRRQGRSLTAELTGAWAMTLIGPIVVLVGGGELMVATSIGALLAFRQTAAILYVRHRLRAAYGKPTPHGTAVICICLGLIVSVPLIGVCAIGWIGVGAVAMILLRALAVQWVGNRPVAPKRVGLTELLIGVSFALLVAIDQLLIGWGIC